MKLRIPWRRLKWVLAATVPLAAVAGVIWLSTRDLSHYQARLAEQVHKVTGRELAAKVPLAVKLSRDPAMVAEGVTLSNATWASRPELARVRKVTVYIDPVSLLLGEIRIGRVVLEGADILVEQNEVGDTNLDMLPPPDGSGPHAGENRSLRLRATTTFPWIGTIEVRDSVVTIAGGSGRPAVVVEIPSATFRSSAPNQPVQVEGRFAAPKGTPMELTGTAGTFEGWMRSLPGNVDLQGGFGGGKIAIKGGVGVKGTAVQVNAEGPDLSVLGPYVQLPVPAGGPYAMAVKAGTQRNAFKVELASLKVGGSEATGDALFKVDRKGVATATINADVTRLDLRDLHAAPAAPEANNSPAQPRLVPSQPFAAKWLGRSTLSLNAQFGEVLGLGSSKMQNASLSLTSSESRFAFRAAATIGGGSAAFDLAYDPAGRFGQATVTASANRVPVGDIGALLGFDWGAHEGLADVDLRLRGGGRTTRDALNGASGSLDVSIAKGTWPRDQLASWPAETQRLLAPADPVAFNCVAGHFDITGGVAFLRRLVIDTPRAVLVGGGYVQMRSEGWEFLFAPEARDNQTAALALPARLKGSGSHATTSAVDAGVARLLVGAGAVPNIAGQLNLAARQAGANPCAVVAPRVEALRPGLRGQLPVPPTDQRRAPRPQSHAPAPTHSRGHQAQSQP
ncbi:MAG: AsmA family protein [Alphaproteobacteria bacterium]|nr:AsmA family protein [Alphaproteobacteria bacterium]MBV8407079.1 AsmA family protein [Alphaproteobacteria bacterium]